jgi:hypothetical protein
VPVLTQLEGDYKQEEEVCMLVLQPSPEQVLLLVGVAELRELVWELLLGLLP